MVVIEELAMPSAANAVTPAVGHTKHFTIHREGGEWYWTLIAANSRKVARSAHGYPDKHGCIQSARALSMAAYDATVFNAEDNAYEL
jgi:uncharacterized protein YegP (UPF0339 family)